MTKADIEGYMQDETVDDYWRSAPVAAKEAFIDAMADKQYGRGPTISAWSWFLCGWAAHGLELDP